MIVEKLFPERRSGTSSPSSWFVDWIHQGAKSLAGVNVNRESALTVGAVWRGVNLVAGDVAKVPCYLYRRQGAGKEIADKHPSYHLIRRKPNPWTKAFDFRKVLTANAILKGNGYAWIDQFEGKRILRQLDPTTTQPWSREGGELIYRAVMEGETYMIHGSDMLHIRNMSLDGITGVGLVDKAKEAVGLAMGAERYGASFFGNSARPNVALKYPTTLTPEREVALREAWERAYSGTENANKVAVLQGGIDLATFGLSNEEAQFLGTREFQIRDIANWIGVPPHMLGDTTRTAYASIEQENKSYLQTSLDYWMVAWEEELWEKLLTPEEKASDLYLFEHLRKRLIAMDAKAEAEVLAIQLNNGVLTLDEVRAMDNRQPLPGGQGEHYRCPLNVGILGDDGVPIAPARPAGETPQPGEDPPADPEDDPPEEGPPDDDPPEEDDDDSRTRAAAVLEDAVRRCIRRLTHAANTAARKPSRFVAWLDALRDDHTGPIRDALAMPLWAATGAERTDAGKDAQQAAEAILSRVFHELLDVSGAVKADGLEAAVGQRMATLEFSAADLAAQFIQKGKAHANGNPTQD